jgi:peptidoglycan/xylan/chitin deacetylase (PgdA/CDA1 family)
MKTHIASVKEWFREKAVLSTELAVSQFSAAQMKLFREKASLIVFLFHGLFKDAKEWGYNLVDPQQRVTVDQFGRFVEYYLDCGYTFVSGEDILKGLAADNRYAMITFDDGYYNNSRALPVLDRFKVPAVFFISTNHVLANKCFWWDVLYRARKRSGVLPSEIYRESRYLKSLTAEEIDDYIISNFGRSSFDPLTDIDRPFSPDELREFSKREYVHIGNHTRDHAILTNYADEGARRQILDCQNDIFEITGKLPSIFSYPSGKYSDAVNEILKSLGFKLAISLETKKNYFPLFARDKDFSRLGRFILKGDERIHRQCRIFRSDLSIYHRLKGLLKK